MFILFLLIEVAILVTFIILMTNVSAGIIFMIPLSIMLFICIIATFSAAIKTIK